MNLTVSFEVLVFILGTMIMRKRLRENPTLISEHEELLLIPTGPEEPNKTLKIDDSYARKSMYAVPKTLSTVNKRISNFKSKF